jgi:nucleotide-binding universal stress UspA family protein
MRRVLVPLSGSPLGETILEDACDLAGHRGELLLLHVIPSPATNQGTGAFTRQNAVKGSAAYLESVAAPLRARGLKVEKLTEIRANLSAAIDEAAVQHEVEMVAVATHGRGVAGRILHGGVAWKALANSRVPVFLRHVDDGPMSRETPQRYQVMVPLDGSEYSEKALPIAERLSLKWNAPLWIVRVIEQIPTSAVAVAGAPIDQAKETEDVQAYLEAISTALGGEVRTSTLAGPVVPQLVAFAKKHAISHVVLASHGRTALSRVILGSVADDLIHQLRCGIVVIPALAAGRLEEHDRERRTRTPVGGS